MPYSDTKETSQDKQIAVNRNAITALDTIAWTTSNYQPETTGSPIGVVKYMRNLSGGIIADGATVAGTSLAQVFFNSSGVIGSAGTSTGVWKNVSGVPSGVNEFMYFVRES